MPNTNTPDQATTEREKYKDTGFHWPTAPLPIPELTEKDIARFWSKVEKGPECWTWRGNLLREYGQFSFRARKFRAHRVSMFLAHGPLPERMVVDHICRVKACVNPAHLRLVSMAQNSMENTSSFIAALGDRTHCANGHEFTGRNLTSDRNKNKPYRRCRQCHADNMKAQRHERNGLRRKLAALEAEVELLRKESNANV